LSLTLRSTLLGARLSIAAKTDCIGNEAEREELASFLIKLIEKEFNQVNMLL